MPGLGLGLALAALAAVTAILAWFAWHWTGVARRPPEGMRVYSRAVARAAVSMLVLWCVGVGASVAGYLLLPTAPPLATEPGSGQGVQEPSSPAPATPELDGPDATETPGTASGIAEAHGEPARDPATAEWEFTEQPELPPSLAAAMASAQAAADGSPAGGPEVILGTGDVVVESFDAATGTIVLLNRSDYTVSLTGWSVRLRTPPESGATHWLDVPEGTLIAAHEHLSLIFEAREAGEAGGGGISEAGAGAPASQAVLYDAEGTAH